jgi:hypothetical protein
VRSAISLLILIAAAVPPVCADTIVLKNGGRIVAASVSEEGDRVIYETAAGELSIPKSAVAKIERDNLA